MPYVKACLPVCVLVSAPKSLDSFFLRDYCGFGRCPSSGILKNAKEHSVSETGSVSVLRGGLGDTYFVGSLRNG
jgi:hypothetical protein